MTDPYLHNREFFGTVSGNYRVLTSDTGLIVLVPAIPAHTLFIQKLHVEVTSPTGAELLTFQDGAGIPIVPSVSAAAISHFDFDFGPDGVPCTQATAFVLNITGAVGAIGWVSWEAFKKLTLGTAASAGGGAPTPADSGPPLPKYGRFVGVVNAPVPVVVQYQVGPADASFRVSGNITVTSYAAGGVTLPVTYTDESNTLRIINVPLWRGNAYNIIANAADVWLGSPFIVRAKAGTTITMATGNSPTTITYDVEGLIEPLAGSQ